MIAEIFGEMEMKHWCAASSGTKVGRIYTCAKDNKENLPKMVMSRSATREREVEKPDEGYDSTGEVSSSQFLTHFN